MNYLDIKTRVLECMKDNTGYRPSDIGYFVFGVWKNESLGIPYSPQAHALMIGKYLKKMKDEKLLIQTLDYSETGRPFRWFKLIKKL